MSGQQEFSYFIFHRVRFASPINIRDRTFSGPATAVHWMAGPDSPQAENGLRTWTSPVWCGLSFYADHELARSTFDNSASLPFSEAVERWDAVLRPISHRGQTNWFGSFDDAKRFKALTDPGDGPIAVLTSAGFNPLPPEELKADMPRRIAFITNVDRMLGSFAMIADNVVRANFQLRAPGHDGLTFTLWRSDAAMLKAAYQPGTHRTEVDRYKLEHTADRSSFIRARLLCSSGTWDGNALAI
jgi:hypothetical protein